MKIRNFQARVIAIHIPTIGENKAGVISTIFLAPGFNDVPDDQDQAVREGLKEYIDEGMVAIVGEDDDPFKGSVEKVVAAVKDTYDRDLLEEVRKTAKSRKVKDAVDAQMKKITDHRKDQ